MKTVAFLTTFFITFHSSGQMEERTISDLIRTIDLIDYKPVKKLKMLNQEEFKKFIFAEINVKVLEQLNIDGWYLCENQRKNGFDAYNLYYKEISWELYIRKCKEINMLLELDGVIKQPH